MGQSLRNGIEQRQYFFFTTSIFLGGGYRENLYKDLYLISQMDSDQFVPIWTIACMEHIKALTTDMDIIREVLQGTIATVATAFIYLLQLVITVLS